MRRFIGVVYSKKIMKGKKMTDIRKKVSEYYSKITTDNEGNM